MKPGNDPKNLGLSTNVKRPQVAHPTPQQSNATNWGQGAQPLVSTVGFEREAGLVNVIVRANPDLKTPLVSVPAPQQGAALGGDVVKPLVGKAGEAK